MIIISRIMTTMVEQITNL